MEHTTPRPTDRTVSVAEAARELGISRETVRRWIKSGRLKADRAIRPQGTVWEISLPAATPHELVRPVNVAGHSGASPSEPVQASAGVASHPSPRPMSPTGDAAGLVASIARLIAELAEVRVISDRRADELVRQAETIGELRADLAAVRASLAAEKGERAPAIAIVAQEPSRGPSGHFSRAGGAALAVLVVTVVVLAAALVLVAR